MTQTSSDLEGLSRSISGEEPGGIDQKDIYDVKLTIPGEPRGNWRVVMLGHDKGAVVFDSQLAGDLGGVEGIVRAVVAGNEINGCTLGYHLSYSDLQRFMGSKKETNEVPSDLPPAEPIEQPVEPKPEGYKIDRGQGRGGINRFSRAR